MPFDQELAGQAMNVAGELFHKYQQSHSQNSQDSESQGQGPSPGNPLAGIVGSFLGGQGGQGGQPPPAGAASGGSSDGGGGPLGALMGAFLGGRQAQEGAGHQQPFAHAPNQGGGEEEASHPSGGGGGYGGGGYQDNPAAPAPAGGQPSPAHAAHAAHAAEDGSAGTDTWPEAPPSWHLAAKEGRFVDAKADYGDNQRNTSDPQYRDLRNRAREEGDAMAQAFDASHAAYDEGDGARAKELSNEGHQHQDQMNQLNAQAAQWIFQANNQDSGSNEVDLHGLYVKEALDVTRKAVQEARRRRLPQLRIIVGQGEHSAQHVAKIQPAVENLMEEEHLRASLDPHNRGVVLVHLAEGGREGKEEEEEEEGVFSSGSSRELMTRSLENNDACAIM